MTRQLHPDTRLIYQLRFVPVPFVRVDRPEPPSVYEPTPDEIEAVAAQIRTEWSQAVERARRTGDSKRVPYEVPIQEAPNDTRKPMW